MTIWKFQLILGSAGIMMPKGAKILSFQLQRRSPCIWALVDPKAETELRHFEVVGTGQPLEDEPGNYIGTCQEFRKTDFPLVWHLFERLI